MSTGTQLRVRAIGIKQNGRIPLYTFFMRGRDILRIADISKIRRDDAGDVLGYQRRQVQRHIAEISEYVRSPDALFPNAIILAMSTTVEFKKSRGPSSAQSSSESGWLTIPILKEGSKVAWIVDGQQRTIALSKSASALEVPITAFITDDFEVHRTQFLLVNKVKPLPNGLINELLPVVNTTLPASLARNKIPAALCDILNRDPTSPFYQLVVRQTTDRRKCKEAVIADTGLIQLIRTSLNGAHGCLYPYKNVATGEVDVENIIAVLKIFWSAVRDTFPDAWGLPPSKSRLMGGVGMKSMGALMDRIMSNISPCDPNARERVMAELQKIKPHCAWTEGRWEGLDIPWQALNNTHRHIELLKSILIRLHTGTVG